MAKKKAVIVGGLGMIGRNTIQALEADGGWDIVGLSRRPPPFETSAEFISVDLLDPADAKAKLSGLTDTTHIFYMALTGGLEAENVEGNLALVRNSVGVIAPIAPNLQRVVLTQGGKYYGVHLGPHKSPSKESDPRHLPPNFYYDQQDFIAEIQKGQSWHYTCLRPEAVIGYAEGIPLNTASLIAVYATICREMGVPLNYPGPEAGFNAFNKFIDARLLGRCQVWAATEAKAAGEAFNVTNVSGMRWCNLWPMFTEYFGCKPGVILPLSLASFMEDKEPVWNEIVRKHQLRKLDFSGFGAWSFADWFFGRTWDTILEDTKRIQFGFSEAIDTDQNFIEIFDQMRAERVIPAG
jgi:nucleoside-diphosphate-sugar epimerase